MKILKIPRFQSHRGYCHSPTVIENTMDALVDARRAGYEACEMDLRCTSLGEVVLHHDVSLERIYKIRAEVKKLSLADIESFKITRLSDVLVAKNVPEFLNLELKNETFSDFSLEEHLVRTLKSSRTQKQIIFSSFNPLSLLRLQYLMPSVPRALLVNFNKEGGNPFYLRKMLFAPLLNFQFLHANYRGFDRSILYRFAKQGVQTSLWTLNNQDEAERWLDSGVSSIITDEILPEVLPEKRL